ncbi:MAG TPA: hypothetical protein V6C72_02200 [Chroococcales cyanobacterium]
MGKLGKSLTMSGVFTLYIMCFYYGIGVFMTLAQGGDVEAFAGQSIIVALACYGLIAYGCYQILDWVELNNRPRETDQNLTSPNPDSGGSPNQTSESHH